LRRRISSTFPAHCFFTLRWQKPVPAGEEQNVGTPAVTHDRCVTCTFCIAAAPNARATQHGLKVTGSLTGMASMDHSPSPINLLFSVLIKAILDAVP
jgi:hypothetical protein